MKVLHVSVNYPTQNFPVFGIFVKEQIESLIREGVECDIFFSNGKELGGIKRHIVSIFELRKLLRDNKYDIIHCHHSISALILLFSGRAFFQKCIVSYQNDPSREFGGMFLFHVFYRVFNRIIIKNTTLLLEKQKVVYLPNGTNQDFFRPISNEACRKTLGWDIDKYYILYMDSNMGTRTQKRHDRYEAVLDLLKKKYDNIESVELNNTPRERIPVYMNACNLHLMTSDFEGSPNSVKECLCCNTPVVSTDVGNVREMIGDIEGCYIDESFTPEKLSEYVDMVLSSKIGFKGRDAFLNKGYGIQNVAKKLKQVYQNIV